MKARVVSEEGARISIEGELDFATAVSVRSELESAIDSAGQDVLLDLSGVSRANSVGLSLILVAARRLSEKGGNLRLTEVPQALRSIATVCQLDEWLASVTVSPQAN
ncbi:STAS domain-containing protein [Pseudomonas saliphila]|uniref:STAS domain-containing protein n=1 Tax=Pseudomonas saliphila TaxID=2586906 RepID=UPI001239082C|nr:STAS domain-containing protein [Pseudomonas saliphila]